MTWSIQVNNLSKLYRIGRGHRQRFDSLYEVATDMLIGVAEKLTSGKSKAFLPERVPPRPVEIQSEHMVLAPSQFEGAPEGYFWALRDVSFRVEEGQRIGIIGRNGSGKSTLLKILSRITTPSDGNFRFRGRLISLLEIGTGFHPDLSGRENVYLNAKINGLSNRQIRRIFDEIVDFSELGMQIDTPIKRYSSGMYMRLAFSVAAHLNSEILVVDEVLAVGDTGFQKKCLSKMLEIGNSGRTLLFVSHDMDAVKKLCSSALEISHGRVVSHQNLVPNSSINDPSDNEIVIGAGLQSVASAISDYSLDIKIPSYRTWSPDSAPHTASGKISIDQISVNGDDDAVRGRFSIGEDVHFSIELGRSCNSIVSCSVHLDITNSSGRALVSSSGAAQFNSWDECNSKIRIKCCILGPFFNAGSFIVSLTVINSLDPKDVCILPDVIQFHIDETTKTDMPSVKSIDAPIISPFKWTQSHSSNQQRVSH